MSLWTLVGAIDVNLKELTTQVKEMEQCVCVGAANCWLLYLRGAFTLRV